MPPPFRFLAVLSLFIPSVVAVELPSGNEQFQKFIQQLNNVQLTGHFTVSGKDQPPRKETYEILGIQKLGDGDLWLFTTIVKKGGQKITLPIPLPVKWAGSKPVIHMDNLTIPTMGTFSAFVIFDDDRYAGTWVDC
jgi:hypothetical protein